MEEIELSDEKVDLLKNSILMENTPLGNVVMYYDSKRSTFVYYSDTTIPYRYLEVVSKKYVINNNCKKIYVDMEKELSEAQRKLEEKKKQEEKKKEYNDKKEELESEENEGKQKEETNPQTKKNVFAKLKSYNRDTSLKASTIPVDTKSVSKKIVPSAKEEMTEKIIKENANRYSYEGKLVNFNFLKKVDRKLLDKRYAMSFSEFKKMKNL